MWANSCIDISFNCESVDLFLSHWWKGRFAWSCISFGVHQTKHLMAICIQTRVDFSVLLRLHAFHLRHGRETKERGRTTANPPESVSFFNTPAQSRMANFLPAQSRFYILFLYWSAGAFTNGRNRESISPNLFAFRFSTNAPLSSCHAFSRSERTKNNISSLSCFFYIRLIHKSCQYRFFDSKCFYSLSISECT